MSQNDGYGDTEWVQIKNGWDCMNVKWAKDISDKGKDMKQKKEWKTEKTTHKNGPQTHTSTQAPYWLFDVPFNNKISCIPLKNTV